MEHELSGLLDGVDEPVTVAELEGVVHRAGQRRRATLMAGAAGLLLCGAVAGALARGPVDDGRAGFAAPPQGAKPPAPPADMAMSLGDPVGLPLIPLFRREANGVAIRAYRSGSTNHSISRCQPPDTIHGELSNRAAVTMAMAPALVGDTFAVLGAGRFGQEEGEPVTWATVSAGKGVTAVRLGLAAATDTMAPENGIALLAVPGNGDAAVAEGLDAEGKVVATQKLSQVSHPVINPHCMPEGCVSGAVEVGPGTPSGTPPAAPAQVPAPVAPDVVPAEPDGTQASGQADQEAIARKRAQIEQSFKCEVVPAPPAPAPVTTAPGQDRANVTVPAGPSPAPMTTIGAPMTPAPPPPSAAPTATATTSTTVKAP